MKQQDGRIPALGAVAIVSPNDVWSAGIDAILDLVGVPVVGAWPDRDTALADLRLRNADVLILAKGIAENDRYGSNGRALGGQFHGRVILAIDASDSFTFDDFISLETDGLLLTASQTGQVLNCVDCVLRGGRWIDPGVRDLLGRGRTDSQPQADTFAVLSSREREVARLASSGLSNKRIARALQLTDGTVKMHMHHILAKLQLTSRMELAGCANDGLGETDAEVARVRSMA